MFDKSTCFCSRNLQKTQQLQFLFKLKIRKLNFPGFMSCFPKRFCWLLQYFYSIMEKVFVLAKQLIER